MTRIYLSLEQKAEIVRLKEVEDLPWKKIGEKFGISGEDARMKYRAATHTGSKTYAGHVAEETTEIFQEKENTTFEQGNDFINIICASKRCLTKEDVIAQFNIDLNVWEVERFRVKTSEGYRKDRQVDWHVKDGHATGDVVDSGKMLVVPMYHIEVRLAKRKDVAMARVILNDMLEDAKKFAPKYKKIQYPELKDGLLYEIDMFDIHFGRLTWEEESGANFDIKLARRAIETTLNQLLALVKNYPIKKILLPMGNDFFNVDNKFNTTTGGTPQQEDTRWQKTSRIGREICVWMIDECAKIAPVDVIIVPGNHDEQRSFFLGEALYCWYHKNPNVHVDNAASKQKYYQFGKVLLGFTHGNDIKLEKLPLIMAMDQPDLWASTKYREWHTGDKHHKKDLIPMADEATGMVIRILRSLTALDAWTFNRGFRSLRSSESFAWHPENGLMAQFTAMPELEEKEG